MESIKQFFLDLLTVQDPEKKGDHHWSQSRVYLLLFIILFIGMAISSIFMGDANANFQHAIDAVLWAMIMFASYALVSKGLKYNQLKKIAKNVNPNNPKVQKAVDWARDKVQKEENKENNPELS